jgi:hypothetical protein
MMYPYIHNYVYFTDLSPDGPNIYPLFHFILWCDPADEIDSANFCDIKISIFRWVFHSFNCSMISSQFSNADISHRDPVLSPFMIPTKDICRSFYCSMCISLSFNQQCCIIQLKKYPTKSAESNRHIEIIRAKLGSCLISWFFQNRPSVAHTFWQLSACYLQPGGS